MGSIVEFHCSSCRYSTEPLQIGWGKAGRASYWAGLASCPTCGRIGVADISRKPSAREEPRCGQCGTGLTLLDGTAAAVPCPRCRRTLTHQTLGSWS